MTKYQIAMRGIPKRYRGMLQRACLEADSVGYRKGYDSGYDLAKKESAKDVSKIRPDMMMSIQRLGDANAQIATQLAKILEKL